jgi:hypothetical protein
MSQHLIDTGRRIATTDIASREHREGAVVRTNREGNGSAGRDAHNGAEGAGRGPAGDATLSALEALSRALEEMSKDHEILRERLSSLHHQRSAGRPWRDILAEEDQPGTMQVVSRMLACLAKASGTLRKELVDTLRREGVSIPAIARLFGVTHQRVSNLLRRPAE